ncbi:MAG: aldehyde dehydrogenase family protein [Chitinophagales bacterium]|nr:aldehyde dehydrogenase family protein [Chitinophagales bacterium]
MELISNENSTVLEQSENSSSSQIIKIFKEQESNLQSIKNSTARDRRKKLKLLKSKIFEYREAIQNALFADFKKPAIETDVSEIYPSIAELKHTLNHFEDWMLDEEVDTPITLLGSSAYIRYEAKGNCLLITPWNYPFYLAISPIIYAVAAGNAVILKPSEFTPNTAKILKKLLAEVFSEKEVAVIEGDHHVSTELLKLPFHHIHFTGSPKVGKIVMEAASKNLSTCTLELGGKSPTIVDETANMKEAANKIVWGKFLNEGQTCIAPDYILVHESKMAALVAAMKVEIENKYGSNMSSRMQGGNLCRMVNSRHFSRVQDLVEDAKSQGAIVEYGGDFNEADNYIDPTILSSVPKHSNILQEEIFGPVMPMISYKSIDEALQIINGKERPLALYIFSKKEKNIEYIMQNTSAGGTCINDTLLHITQPNLPFGGINNSGIGKSHGKWGFIDFSNERSVHRQHFRFSMSMLLQPPYNKFSKFVIDMTMKYF